MRANVLLAIVLLAGCDRLNLGKSPSERADSTYRAAMEEYAAGRLDHAAKKFAEVLASNPGNVSARFQLGCVLQEHAHDYLGAVCQYREYLALAPKDDKSPIARARLAECERLLADDLVRKFNLGGTVAMNDEILRLTKESEDRSGEVRRQKKELERLKADCAALQRENERIRRMVVDGGADTVSPARPKTAELPDDDAILEDDGVDRAKLSRDIASLVAEEKDETREAPFGKTVKPAEEKPVAMQELKHEPRPRSYTVREGDTLYKLAVRFYGRRSAWVTIRDANKTVVSTDGRIRAGQVLRFP